MATKKYKSLEEIQERKEELLTDIRQDDAGMRTLWNGLFHKPAMLSAATPTKRFAGMVNVGAGVLDAFLLGWKLYRKFGGKQGSSFSLTSSKKKKRKR